MGYAESKAIDNQFNATVSQFVPMSGTLKLGDIRGINTSWGGSIIMFLNENGGTKKYTLPEDMKTELGVAQAPMTFQYASEEECKEWDDGTTPGWYFQIDEVALFNMNDLVVDDGKGFLFKPMESGAQVQTAGEVLADDVALTTLVENEYNLTGNITPVTIKLGDIVAQNTSWGGSIIMFLNENGGTKKMTLSDEMKGELGVDSASMTFQYASESECQEWDDGTTPGWYLQIDEVALFNMNNEIELKAGEGFLFKPMESGATLVIPGALN